MNLPVVSEVVIPHISHSAITCWNKCAYYYKLRYVDQVKYDKNNIFSVFGNAVHESLAYFLPQLKDYIIHFSLEEIKKYFKELFLKKVHEMLSEEQKKDILKDKKDLFKDMIIKGGFMILSMMKALIKDFPGFKIFYMETEFKEPIIQYEEKEYNFKGIIDLVIQMPDGSFKIIDFKTCSWGWDQEKKSDKLVSYQLTYYKHFFSVKNNIPLDQIECMFALIKRTAKEDKNIEFFEVKVGEKKIKNSLELIKTMLHNVDKQFFPKNKLNCDKCDLYKVHCKG